MSLINKTDKIDNLSKTKPAFQIIDLLAHTLHYFHQFTAKSNKLGEHGARLDQPRLQFQNSTNQGDMPYFKGDHIGTLTELVYNVDECLLYCLLECDFSCEIVLRVSIV